MHCLNDHLKTRSFQSFFLESNMILHIYTESEILLIVLWGNFEKKKKNNVFIEKFEVNYGEPIYDKQYLKKINLKIR